MAKPKSRPARWAEALKTAREAYDNLSAALEALHEIQQEYDEWKSNLPENLENSTLAQKLDDVLNMDFESCASEVESTLDEAEAVELPQGFGRD